MNKQEFVDLVFSGSKNNRELEDKVDEQGYVYVKRFFRTLKLDLMSMSMFPYGTFEVGHWNGKDWKHRTTLNWKDYKKTWSLTEEELL